LASITSRTSGKASITAATERNLARSAAEFAIGDHVRQFTRSHSLCSIAP
jgi:hypothetical protein